MAVKKKTKEEKANNPVKTILVSQPEPKDENSPYFKLAEKHNLTVDFRPFIQVEPVLAKEFRNTKISILEHTAIIFTSRNAVDNFFRMCEELKLEVPSSMKYFCISEQTSYYLQKYIVLRKRKLFTGVRTASDLIEVIKKHKGEKFLFPCSNIRTEDIPVFMNENGFDFTESAFYRTVASDLSDLADIKYDIIAFFSPSGIQSLFKNFPEFVQGKTRIAVFGPTTAKAAVEAGLIPNVQAPMPNAPSMTGAIELYIKDVN